MIRLLTAVLLFASFNVVAEVTLTPLSNNTPADADDVMGNFNALNEALPPSNCTTNQIIKWNGSAWVCADSVLTDTGCEPGDRVVFGSSGWECTNSFPIWVNITGLDEGNVVTVSVNGSETQFSSTGFQLFSAEVEGAAAYSVAIAGQPPSGTETCELTSSPQGIALAAVEIQVKCYPRAYLYTSQLDRSAQFDTWEVATTNLQVHLPQGCFDELPYTCFLKLDNVENHSNCLGMYTEAQTNSPGSINFERDRVRVTPNYLANDGLVIGLKLWCPDQ